MTTLLKDYASVILFSYQKAAPRQRMTELKKCLKSIYENTLFPFELIVYDNGSDPRTQKFLLSELTDKRISTLVLNPPGWGRSFGVSINRSWNLSKGEFLVKLDSNCIVEEGWLLDGVTAMQVFPEISYWGFMHFHPQEETLLREVRRGGISVQAHCNSPNKAFMIRRSTWKELGDFPELDADFDENWLSKVVPSAQSQPPITSKKRKGYWRGMNSSNKWLALPLPTRQKIRASGESILSRAPIQFTPLLFGDLDQGQVSVKVSPPPRKRVVKKKEYRADDWGVHPQLLPKVRDKNGMPRSRLESLKNLT